MGGVTDDVLLARAFLSRVAEPGCVPLWTAVRTDGPVDVVRAIRNGTADAAVLAATRVRAALTDPYADLEAAERIGVRLVVPEDDEWPHFAFGCLESAGLRRAAEFGRGEQRKPESGEPIPPLALWVRGRGDLAAAGVRSAALVGARVSSRYGEYVTRELAEGLTAHDFTIVSGGAHGIDAAAHRAALDTGGTTTIVSAGGLDRPYPPTNADLYEQAAHNGLVVSENPPGTAPQRHRFLSRNRLIAALSAGTVVVEAARRSGAHNTAAHCRRLGRPVMVVPGPVTSVTSAGCHDLLIKYAEQTSLVTCVDDVLAVLGSSSSATPTTPGTLPAPQTLPQAVSPAQSAEAARAATQAETQALLDALAPTPRRLFDAFPARRSVGVDELSVVANVAPLDVLRSLPSLELCGLVESADGGYRRRRRAGRDSP